MNLFNQVKMQVKKSKLVTISSEEYDSYCPPFEFKEKSHVQGKDVSVSFPAHPANLMYYEHYDSLTSLNSNRLEFVYVGGYENGDISHDFFEYPQVRTVDFSDGLPSIKTMFKIISQLPNCEEVRVYFDSNNISRSDTDSNFLAQKRSLQQFGVVNVKRLWIKGSENIESTSGNDQRTKFHDLLEYAFLWFPKLEALRIDMEKGGRKSYDFVEYFCTRKSHLPKHTYQGNDEKLKCFPDTDLSTISSIVSPTVSSSSSSHTLAVGNDVDLVGSSTFEGIGRMQSNDDCSSLTRPIEKRKEGSGRVSNSKESCHYSSNDAVSREEHLIPSKKQRLQLDGGNSYTGACSIASASGNGFSCDEYEYENQASPFLVPPPKPRTEAAGAEQYYSPSIPPPSSTPFSVPIGRDASNMIMSQTDGHTLNLDMNQIDFDRHKIKDILKSVQTHSNQVSSSNQHHSRSRRNRLRVPIEGVDYERRPRQRFVNEDEGSTNT